MSLVTFVATPGCKCCIMSCTRPDVEAYLKYCEAGGKGMDDPSIKKYDVSKQLAPPPLQKCHVFSYVQAYLEVHICEDKDKNKEKNADLLSKMEKYVSIISIPPRG